MDNNESFVFYASFWDALDGMSEEMQFHILRAVIEYGLRDAEPEGLNAFEDMAFRLIRPQLDANNKRREKGRENGMKGKEFGKLGGRPKKSKPKEEVEGENTENPQGDIVKTPEGLLQNPQGDNAKPPNVNISSMSSVILDSEKDTLKSMYSVSEIDSKDNIYHTEEIDIKNILDGIDNINNNNKLDGMDIENDEIVGKCIELDDLCEPGVKHWTDKMSAFMTKYGIVPDHCGWPLEECDWDKIDAEYAASSYLRSNPRYRSLKWIAYNHKTIEGGCFRPKKSPAEVGEQEAIEGNPFEDWK